MMDGTTTQKTHTINKGSVTKEFILDLVLHDLEELKLILGKSRPTIYRMYAKYGLKLGFAKPQLEGDIDKLREINFSVDVTNWTRRPLWKHRDGRSYDLEDFCNSVIKVYAITDPSGSVMYKVVYGNKRSEISSVIMDLVAQCLKAGFMPEGSNLEIDTSTRTKLKEVLETGGLVTIVPRQKRFAQKFKLNLWVSCERNWAKMKWQFYRHRPLYTIMESLRNRALERSISKDDYLRIQKECAEAICELVFNKNKYKVIGFRNRYMHLVTWKDIIKLYKELRHKIRDKELTLEDYKTVTKTVTH